MIYFIYLPQSFHQGQSYEPMHQTTVLIYHQLPLQMHCCFLKLQKEIKIFNSSKMVPFKTLLLRVANKENQRQNAFFMCLLLSNLFCCRKNMYLSLLLLLDNAEIQNLCFCIWNYKLFSWGFKLFVFLVLVK